MSCREIMSLNRMCLPKHGMLMLSNLIEEQKINDNCAALLYFHMAEIYQTNAKC